MPKRTTSHKIVCPTITSGNVSRLSSSRTLIVDLGMTTTSCEQFDASPARSLCETRIRSTTGARTVKPLTDESFRSES
jgi:hypothetical protein